ncbi:MAG TPA: glycosyltransferase family 39 protein [Vicinamibacteria bacterium]|nr:glycosyltransferase family 39 protein [Vicinamibacteria bacterium]
MTDPWPPWPRRTLSALCAVAVVAGIAGRTWRLGLPGLSSDEAFSWRLTRYPLVEMLGRAGQDVHPPLYYVVLEAWTRALGDSIVLLRGLSVLLGLVSIGLAFAVVRVATRLEGTPRRSLEAASLAAALLAIHATQIAQSRNARMYALGTVLALASAWLVLRAPRASSRRLPWWMAWGLAAAAAGATHYYLLFTIAGQGLWVLSSRPRARARDLAGAAAVGIAVFAPWAPVFWRQVRQVRADYWIPPLTAGDLAAGVARWAIGCDLSSAAPLAAVLVVASIAAAACGGGRAGRFFAVQAIAPWVLGLAASAVSGRPIVLDRYMLFAEAFLLCAWAVAVATIERPLLRIAAAALLLVVLGVGTWSTVRAIPVDSPAMANAARFLKRQAGASDLVVVDSPRALNKLRYYARQAGGERLDIRCALPERVPLSPHVSHVVSLAAGDAVAADAVFAAGADTVWRGRESTAAPEPAPAGWAITYAQIFEGGEATRFGLVRYGREAAAP